MGLYKWVKEGVKSALSAQRKRAIQVPSNVLFTIHLLFYLK